MRKAAIALLISASLLTSVCAAAEKSGGRAFVELGLAAYLNEGPEAAIRTWLLGSGMESETQAKSQANSFRQVQDFYGKPESYDIIKEATISPRSQMIVFSINYEKGIAYGRFQIYLTKSGKWVSTEFKFHTEAVAVLPQEMVFGK